MNITTVSSRAFNQDIGQAKRAADSGPVIVTDRGEPAYVLMRHDAWRRLVGQRKNLLLTLDMPGTETIEFDPPRLPAAMFKAAEIG